MVTQRALRVATRFCARDGLDQKLALATALCDVQVEQCWYIIEVWKSTRIDLFSLCICFTNTGIVMILLGSVSFNFRIIHVHMYA